MRRAYSQACRQLPPAVFAFMLVLFGQRLNAQSISRVEGIAFDSLAGRPFAGALITVRGTSRSAFADARGHFTIDSLPYGRYRFDVNDPTLEARALGGVSQELVVDAAVTRTVVAFPSFATIAGRLCGRESLPEGSQTIVVGMVRDAQSERVLSGAEVEIVGSDLVSKSGGAASLDAIRQRTWTGRATTDSQGTYTLCGLPQGVNVVVSARYDRFSMGIVESVIATRAVLRQDLWLAPDDDDAVGVVRGTVFDAELKTPLADVQVVVAGAEPARTNSQGQYTVARSPLGTREIEFRRLGVVPIRRQASVRTSATTTLNVELQRLTRLDAIRSATVLSGQQRILEMERRRDLKLGYFADSTDLLRYSGLAAAIQMISGQKSVCAAFIDGIKQKWEDVARDTRPYMIAQLEVQTHFTPIEYQQRSRCPVLLIWTKHGAAR
jgi:hypothetical protein